MARQLQGQSPLWTQQYGTPAYDAGFSVSKTFDSGFIVGGITTNDNNTKDILLIKLNAAGDTLWTHTYGSSYSEESFSVAQCRDSGYIIAGLKAQGNTDMYIIRTNAQGTELWNRTYGGALNDGSYSIIQTYDSGFAVCGYTASTGAGLKDMQLLKYDANGNLLWQKTYGGALDETAYALIQTADSGFVLTGTTKSYSGNGNSDIYLLKTTSAGDTLWTKTYPMPGTETAYSVTVTNGNYYLITGKTNTDSAQQVTTDYNAFALKVNTLGHVIFYQTYGSPAADECAYSVNEMPDLSYVLVGSRTESGITYPLIIKTGEWGETIDYLSSDTPSEPRNFCVDDNETIVTVGKIFNNSNWDLYLTADALCKVYYPRYIWINNVYNNATNAPADILGDMAATEDLADYLAFFKYSGIVITHFEDLYVDNATTYIQLRNFIKYLHLRGIPVVLGQYRTSENTLTSTASKTKMDDFLAGFISYNIAAYAISPFAAFDGILLDYEFWQDDYGIATTPFKFINEGWVAYQSLCADIIAARSNPANHLKIAATWIGRILEPGEHLWNVDGDGNIGFNSDPDDTHQAVMDKIDTYNFDRIVLAFFLTEKLNIVPFHESKKPTCFLTRDGDLGNPDAVYEPDWFMRLWYFSNNNILTNIVPNFHAGYGNTGTSANPKLVNYLLGQGYYTTPNYLGDAEAIFLAQFNNPAIFTNYNNTGPAWNSINLQRGFEWFRYEIGPMDVASITTRPADAIHPFYNPCYLPNRLSNQTIIPVTTTNTFYEASVTIAPQPLIKNGTLHIATNLPLQRATLQFTNAIGQNVSHHFKIIDTEVGNHDSTIYFEMTTPLSGVYWCKIMIDGQCVGNVKCVTLK